jgi:hypothetical protein
MNGKEIHLLMEWSELHDAVQAIQAYIEKNGERMKVVDVINWYYKTQTLEARIHEIHEILIEHGRQFRKYNFTKLV